MSEDGWEDDGWDGQEESTTTPEVGAGGDGESPQEGGEGGDGESPQGGGGDNKCRNCRQVGVGCGVNGNGYLESINLVRSKAKSNII